jgi:hypothetical protein
MDVSFLLACTDLRALAEEAGARFGHGQASRCPLHPGADNPSAFHLYRGRDGRARWHCFTRCPPGPGLNDGDAIAFYMRWQGVDYPTAVHELAFRAGQAGPGSLAASAGGLKGGPATEGRHREAHASQQTPRETPKFVWQRWQAKAREFQAYAREVLWSPEGQAAAGYLCWERGLADDTLWLWGLGYNPEDVWDRAEDWGLALGPRGGPNGLWLPRGIVIPAWQGSTLAYIKVRRPQPGDALARAIGQVAFLPGAKYAHVRGGRPGLYGVDAVRGLPVLLMAEGEFDALLAWQLAGDLADVVTLGSATQQPNREAARALRQALKILVAYDADAAGARGKRFWQRSSRRAVAVELPALPGSRRTAHDITAFWQAGGDVRNWIGRSIAAASAAADRDVPPGGRQHGAGGSPIGPNCITSSWFVALLTPV